MRREFLWVFINDIVLSFLAICLSAHSNGITYVERRQKDSTDTTSYGKPDLFGFVSAFNECSQYKAHYISHAKSGLMVCQCQDTKSTYFHFNNECTDNDALENRFLVHDHGKQGEIISLYRWKVANYTKRLN